MRFRDLASSHLGFWDFSLKNQFFLGIDGSK
jgi:hypothetical protein